MKNIIKLTIYFSYQGVDYSPSALLHLDDWMEKQNSLPHFDLIIAQRNDIDTYSHLYEILQHGRFLFDNAQGMSANYCQDNCFDTKGFQQAWREQQILRQLTDIAEKTLHIDSLEENPAIKQALMKAWQTGKDSCKQLEY